MAFIIRKIASDKPGKMEEVAILESPIKVVVAKDGGFEVFEFWLTETDDDGVEINATRPLLIRLAASNHFSMHENETLRRGVVK